ncbi:MAG: choice-of-anchor N protein [Candidatus Competibacteraceae bacterium]|nr:choice-of-anchor N protein [Candidatus Competibacteraceae bacterium]
MGIKTGFLKYAALVGFAIATSLAHAVPVLQIGAPAGVGDVGTYADYTVNLTDPTEKDTAVTESSTIYVAGVYQNNNVLNLGAQFGSGSDWSAISSNYQVFNGKGGILVAAVPDGQLAAAIGTLLVNGNTAFHSSSTLNSLFPNNHDPLKDSVSDFLFFDIGNFVKNLNQVPDFKDETGTADGEIKTLTISGFGSLAWIHFDVLAIETSEQGGGSNVKIVSTIENNPGSHDVTWKKEGGGGGTQEIPEPASSGLLGLGLLAIGALRRRKVARI